MVGVDIGCGMSAIKTDLKSSDISKDDLQKIQDTIYKEVPVGFAHRQNAEHEDYMPIMDIDDKYPCIEEIIWNDMLKQLGTLGGGNHFIEIQ
jgi:tRNA-splicing ligase RtcB